MKTITRVAPGVPTGGEFTAHARPESDTVLGYGNSYDPGTRVQRAGASALRLRQAFNAATPGSQRYYELLREHNLAIDDLEEARREFSTPRPSHIPSFDLENDHGEALEINARLGMEDARRAFNAETPETPGYYRAIRVHNAAFDVWEAARDAAAGVQGASGEEVRLRRAHDGHDR